MITPVSLKLPKKSERRLVPTVEIMNICLDDPDRAAEIISMQTLQICRLESFIKNLRNRTFFGRIRYILVGI